jgi:menaquinone-specific isochorismate synthase
VSLVVGDETVELADLSEHLARELVRSHDNGGAHAGIRRISIPIRRLDIYDWLSIQHAKTQMLWAGREDDWRVAGIGEALVITPTGDARAEEIVDRCRLCIDGNEDIRFYGGFAFSPTAANEDAWQSFGAARFWLPRFEVMDGPDETRFVVHMGPEERDAATVAHVMAEFEQLRFAGDRPALSPISSRHDLPDESGWCDRVRDVLALIEDEMLEKLVLARRVTYAFEEPVTAASIIAKLSRITTNCYHFVLQPDAGAAFMGTTPERFFRRTGRDLESEVIAGTRPRGITADDDARLADDLLNSSKDQNEHDIVRKCLKQRLHLLCGRLSVDEEAQLLRLERKQHLQSRIEGQLLDHVTDGRLIEELHPTPAVGGYPQENAVHEIERLEPFRRGWYASPVGWIGANAIEFAVAIRSGLVRERFVDVYSGAGIVAGSEPVEEWREVEHKISDFVKVTSLP